MDNNDVDGNNSEATNVIEKVDTMASPGEGASLGLVIAATSDSDDNVVNDTMPIAMPADGAVMADGGHEAMKNNDGIHITNDADAIMSVDGIPIVDVMPIDSDGNAVIVKDDAVKDIVVLDVLATINAIDDLIDSDHLMAIPYGIGELGVITITHTEDRNGIMIERGIVSA